MQTRALALLALSACEIAGAPPPVAPPVAPVGETPVGPDAGIVGMAAPTGCPDLAADAARRADGMTVKPARTVIDLDGDGVADPAYTGSCSMMGGNCETYLYATAGSACPRYVGHVQVTEVSSGPSCAEPPAGHAPCRLSASRMMIHGEIYEYFYTYGPAGYAESGVGREGPPPPSKRP